MDIETQLVNSAFRDDVLRCFDEPCHAIPARWLYDQAGSELFEQITQLPEYYPTRTETGLLKRHCAEIIDHGGKGRAVVEFGSGSSAKTPHLLNAVDPSAYVPIDISGEFLSASSADLQSQFSELPIYPLEADFMRALKLPEEISQMPKLGFFPGSTIGNMIARTSVDLLRSMRETLGVGSLLLVGFDRIKDTKVLIDAYDDSAGVTARFSLNLLHRINRELGGSIPVEQFRHVAIWNDLYARIEIYLEARADVSFAIEGVSYSMAKGQGLHIENSHKYDLRDARLMLRAGGWSPICDWSDDNDYFSLILAGAHPLKHAP